MSGIIAKPRHASHPDCRAPLTQIDAPHAIYTHVATEILREVVSPLERLQPA